MNSSGMGVPEGIGVACGERRQGECGFRYKGLGKVTTVAAARFLIQFNEGRRGAAGLCRLLDLLALILAIEVLERWLK